MTVPKSQDKITFNLALYPEKPPKQNPTLLSIGVGRAEMCWGLCGLVSREMTAGLWSVANTPRERRLVNTNICFKFPCFSVNRSDGLKLTALVHFAFVPYRTSTCYLCIPSIYIYIYKSAVYILQEEASVLCWVEIALLYCDIILLHAVMPRVSNLHPPKQQSRCWQPGRLSHMPCY